MSQDNRRWRQGFHLMPPTGWLNDPNGLIQHVGIYHVFFQYDPTFPAPGERGWGHYVSRDLVHWTFVGMAVRPDTASDADGAYSGSAVVADGRVTLIYTGNVKLPGDHDYVTSGRLANQMVITSSDGRHFSGKRRVMSNTDYPPCCSCHVRDPKVWEQGGRWHMVLGARDLDSQGMALVYDATGRSASDLATWTLSHVIRPTSPFGYMWECPDRICLAGREFLSCSPQGLPREATRWQNVYQSGYFPLAGDLLDTHEVDPGCFREWDMGFDFYAPQSFVDESGRTIMLGWMGLPDIDYANPSDAEEGWVHCLTVPRELTPSATGDVIRQTPVGELAELRGRGFAFASGEGTLVDGGRADVVCEGGLAEGGRVTLGTKSCPVALTLEVSNGLLSLTFAETCGAGAGRTRRVAPVRSIRDLRILVDRSSVEVFANGGEVAMSTRWYPSDLTDGLVVGLVGTGSGAVAWPMADAMTSTYATGEAR